MTYLWGLIHWIYQASALIAWKKSNVLPKTWRLKAKYHRSRMKKKVRALRRERPLKKISSWLLCCSTIETQTSSRRQLPQTLRSKKKFLLRKMDLRLLTFFATFWTLGCLNLEKKLKNYGQRHLCSTSEIRSYPKLVQWGWNLKKNNLTNGWRHNVRG